MGQTDVATTFEKRAGYWRNSFDTKTGFLRARKSDGTYREPFNPTAINYGSDYTEGNAWQYSWFAPQDLGGVVKTLGGDAATVKKLDAMFDFDNSKIDYSHAEDIAGLIGQYIHGNEPSHHVAYMYAYARPWRTQGRLKQIVDRRKEWRSFLGHSGSILAQILRNNQNIYTIDAAQRASASWQPSLAARPNLER